MMDAMVLRFPSLFTNITLFRLNIICLINTSQCQVLLTWLISQGLRANKFESFHDAIDLWTRPCTTWIWTVVGWFLCIYVHQYFRKHTETIHSIPSLVLLFFGGHHSDKSVSCNHPRYLFSKKIYRSTWIQCYHFKYKWFWRFKL